METGILDKPDTAIVVIGAGIGGITFAIALKRKLGLKDFIIFEKANGVGGTWRDNIYPGCSSDVGVHFYSLSTDLKPDWTSSHPPQPEIQAYWESLSDKYAVTPHVRFNMQVVSASWDAKTQLYHVVARNLRTDEMQRVRAKIVVSALGILEVPRYPAEFEGGLRAFSGKAFHSARWDLSVGLEGKKVAVVGNGASATQFVPIISKTPGIRVTQFCRTPNWIFPPIRSPFRPWQIWLFKYIPLLMRLYRLLLYLRTELNYFLIFSNLTLGKFLAKHLFRRYIQRNAPKQYLDKLVPNYNLGCKRIIFDTDYLAALHQDNLELNWDGIANIAEDGILTKRNQKLDFDVIIFATGYCADKYPLEVYGVDGKSIQDYYDCHGGPTAFIGTCVPGFPNFFMISGPNTATGHTSVILTEEIQIDYIIKVIKPILQRTVVSVEITDAATDAYNEKIQKRLSKSVFVHCFSWYRVDGKGKVNSIFPGPAVLMWWWLRRPNWKDYKIVGGSVEDLERGSKVYRNWALAGLLASTLILSYVRALI